MVFKAFESGIFLSPEKSKQGIGLKILTPNQMFKRLPIALAQIKAGNNSESLLNDCLFFVSIKKITEKVCNNIIKSVKV